MKFIRNVCLILFSVGALAASAHPVANQVVWFGIPTTNLEDSQKFYQKIFGWTYSEPQKYGDERFSIVHPPNSKQEIGDITETKSVEKGLGVAIYFNVNDTAETFNLAKTLGAEVVYAPMPLPDMPKSTIAMVRDQDGNRIGFYSEKADR